MTLASSPTNRVVTRFEMVAPDRLAYRIEGGQQAVVIGAHRWDRSPGGRWVPSAQSSLQVAQKKLDDLAAAYLNRKGTRLFLEAPVDGLNRPVGRTAMEKAYAQTSQVGGEDGVRLLFALQATPVAEVAAWLRGASVK